jgi:hypothetical protein
MQLEVFPGPPMSGTRLMMKHGSARSKSLGFSYIQPGAVACDMWRGSIGVVHSTAAVE